MSRRIPSLCSQPDGRSFVWIRENGTRKKRYFGRTSEPETQRRYEVFVAELTQASGAPIQSHSLTVSELCLMFIGHAKTHYRKNGQETSEVACFRHAMRPLIKLYGPTTVQAFGPRRLDDVRKEMILLGYCRDTINKHTRRIRQIVKWGISQEAVSPNVLVSLQTLPPLRKGRTHIVRDIVAVVSTAVISTLKAIDSIAIGRVAADRSVDNAGYVDSGITV